MISYYNNVKNWTKERDIPIAEFIDMVKNGAAKKQIEEIRHCDSETERKRLKMLLPCVTASGTFDGNKTDDKLLKHSGFIQIDFDHVAKLIETRAKLEADRFTYACFLSPTGNGIKLLVKISPSVKTHLDSFNALEVYYKKEFDMKIDTACKNVSRAFFLSWDESVFVNENAETFEGETKAILNVAEGNMNTATHSVKIKAEPVQTKKPTLATGTTIDKSDVLEDVENVVRQIVDNGIDITEPYTQYINIGFALASEFGESGRGYFHAICQNNSKYDISEIDKQYNESIKKRKQGITIKSLFYYAKQSGIDIRPKKTTDNPQKKIKISNVDKPESKFAQVETYLSNIYDFRNNIVSNEIEIKRKEDKDFEPCNEKNIYRELQHQGINFSINNLGVMLGSDFVEEYNPFSYYFESLPEYEPSKEPDYIGLLCGYIHTKDQNRFNVHFRKMLVRSVACALDDNVFNKQAFILVHDKQNSGKSTFCRWLCPPALGKYMAENLNTDKDGQIALSENFYINLDELATMSKHDLNTLKSYFSKDKVKIRRPFDKKSTTTPRRANFIGSTNNLDFLTDLTGSVRWLCFELERINWDYKKDFDINLIYAQAYHLFRNGFKFQLDESELADNETANEEFTMLPMEYELLVKHFAQGTKEDQFYTTTDLLNAICLKTVLTNKLSPKILGQSLRKAGFKREKPGQNYGFYLKEV